MIQEVLSLVALIGIAAGLFKVTQAFTDAEMQKAERMRDLDVADGFAESMLKHPSGRHESPPHLHWSTPVTDLCGEPVGRYLCVDCYDECERTVVQELPDGTEFTVRPGGLLPPGNPAHWVRTKDDPTPIKAERVALKDGRTGYRFEIAGQQVGVIDDRVRFRQASGS